MLLSCTLSSKLDFILRIQEPFVCQISDRGIRGSQSAIRDKGSGTLSLMHPGTRIFFVAAGFRLRGDEAADRASYWSNRMIVTPMHGLKPVATSGSE